MTTDRELMQQALDALEQMAKEGWLLHGPEGMDEAQTKCIQSLEALRARLAQPEQEKSRSQKMIDAGFTKRDTLLECDGCGKKFSRFMLPIHACEDAQPEQEPVAQVDYNERGNICWLFGKQVPDKTLLYTAPPQSEWQNAALRLGEELSTVGPDGYYNMSAFEWLDWAMKHITPARIEQEPVAWITTWNEHGDAGVELHWAKQDKGLSSKHTPLYYAPQREWQGLTDEDIEQIHYGIKCKGIGAYSTNDIYRAIEAKLKEKNA